MGKPKFKLGDIVEILDGSNIKNYTGHLMGVSEPVEKPIEKPFYNGKVVCLDNRNGCLAYIVGKIYKFKDGQLIAENGNQFPLIPIYSFDEFTKNTDAKFIEIVE